MPTEFSPLSTGLSSRARWALSDGSLTRRHVGHDVDRARVVRDVKLGALDRRDVCDAGAHLISSAEVLGDRAEGSCPICGKDNLKIIRWIHGVGLGERSGTARNVNEIRSVVDDFLDAGQGEISIHTVEVCLSCKWNYLRSEDILQAQESHIPHHLTEETQELELD